MGLDRNFTDRAYLIGRAVAYTELLTGTPVGFVGKVSDNPLDKLPYHLREALKAAVKCDEHGELADIADMVLRDGLPSTLKAQEQNRFWVGYYHQKHALAEDGERQRIADLVKRAREAKGISQQTLAERCGMSASHIARIESGRYSLRADILGKIADVLGTRLDFVEQKQKK